MKKLTILFFIFFIQNVLSQEQKVIEKNQIFNLTEIDKHPDFPGGPEKLYNFINTNLILPKTGEKIKRKIFVRFVVEVDGSLSNIEFYKENIDKETSDAITRVLEISPKWNAGEIKKEKVRVLYAIPINI